MSNRNIGENGKGAAGQQDALRQVAKGGERKTPRHHQRHQDVYAHDRAHHGCPLLGVLNRNKPHGSDCMFGPRSVSVTGVTQRVPGPTFKQFSDDEL